MSLPFQVLGVILIINDEQILAGDETGDRGGGDCGYYRGQMELKGY